MKMWKTKPKLSALCLLGLSALTPVVGAELKADQQDEETHLSTVPGSENDTVTLGTAYHSEYEGFYTVTSVLGKEDTSYGNSEMDLTVGVDAGYSQLYNMLDGKLGAQLSVPAVSAGIGASYAKEHAADSYTGTYTLFMSLKPKKKILVPDDDSGFKVSQAATDIVINQPGNLFENIGDEFVTAIEYGSQVMVNLKFEYKNSEDKVKWGGQLNVDWAGGVSVGGSLTSVDNNIKKNIKISVSAIQMGGDESRILSVIPDKLIECTMLNPQPCFEIFANTITYMKTDFVNQFNSLNDYNVVKLYTDKYKTSGPGLALLVPQTANPEKSLLTKLAIDNMTERWVQSNLDHRRADNLLNYYGTELTAAQRDALSAIRHNALTNAGLWASAVGYCNENPFGNYCRDREVETQTYVVAYDRQLLEI